MDALFPSRPRATRNSILTKKKQSDSINTSGSRLGGVTQLANPSKGHPMNSVNGTVPIHRTIKPGESLRRLRMRLGLSTRRVAELSRTVAAKHGSSDFSISHARLVQ